MRASMLLLLLVLPLGACRGSNAHVASPTPPAAATSTPITGSLSLFDLGSFERVYSIGGIGRIPLGLANAVIMRSANARIGTSVEGRSVPPYVRLSMVFDAPLPAMMTEHGRTGVTYEWWFSSTDASDDTTKTGIQATFKVALRFVSQSWAMYVDTGSGWHLLPDVTFAFGEYELSARLPRDPSWSIASPRSAYFRAVTARRRLAHHG